MSDNHTIQLAEIPIGGKGGVSWNRLHEEREEICEALLKETHQHEEVLQARLRRIDDALDRMMSGANLDRNTDSEIILESLNAFDTILIHTHNSDYRIMLLDPKTGRALVEGGSYLLEPTEGLLKGSALPGSVFNSGAICVGGRLEMWVNEQVFLTSPIIGINVALSSSGGRYAERATTRV